MSVGQESRPSLVVSSVSRSLTAALEVSARAVVSYEGSAEAGSFQ